MGRWGGSDRAFFVNLLVVILISVSVEHGWGRAVGAAEGASRGQRVCGAGELRRLRACSRASSPRPAPSGRPSSCSTLYTNRQLRPSARSPSARMSQSGSSYSGYIGSPFRSAMTPSDPSRRQFVWQGERGLVSRTQLQREQQLAQPAPTNEAERILQMLEGISTVSWAGCEAVVVFWLTEF